MKIIHIIITCFLLIPFSAISKLDEQGKIDSIKNVLSTYNNNDSNKVKLLCALSKKYAYTDPNMGIIVGKQAIQLAETINWKPGIALANNTTSLSFDNISDLTNATKYSLKALKIYEDLGYKKGIAQCLSNIGTDYSSQGDYASAIDYFLKALKIAEETHYIKMQSICMVNLATAYLNMQDFTVSLSYCKKSLIVMEQIDDKEGIGICCVVAANNFLALNLYDSALIYIHRAIGVMEEIGNKVGIAELIAQEGDTYRGQGKYQMALDCYSRAMKDAKEMGITQVIAGAHLGFGLTYFELYNDSSLSLKAKKTDLLKKSAENLTEAVEIYKNIKSLSLLTEAYLYLSKVYTISGNTELAFINYKEHVAINDSMRSTNSKLKIAALETKRETELKDKQIEINKIQAKQKQTERILFLSGSGLLLILVLSVRRGFNKQKRTNRLLVDEKKKSDELAVNLQESIIQKDIYAGQLAESAVMKSKFLANISHELRTPVTLLTGMLELIRGNNNGNPTNGEKAKLDLAYNNSRKLQYMIEEILDLSRLDNTNGLLNSQTKEIAPMLRRMVYAFETFIEKESLKMEYNDEGMQAVLVLVDEDKLEKIINNLVYNAIKFNRKGGFIKVIVQLTNDRQKVVIEISDSGVGISEADQPHIFERFYQSESSGAKAEGAGIGLSLVKEFTLLLGGSVNVASKQGTGTTFTLQFPVAEKNQIDELFSEELTPLPAMQWERFPEKPTILLVEDNTEMRYYLKEVLGDSVTIAEAGNGKEALSWLQQHTTDLIISDVMMPEMDGKKFVVQLKTDEQYKKIPVITLTALVDKDSQMAMLRMGVDDYLVKPFDADELRIRVYNILSNYAERKAFTALPIEAGDIPTDSKEAGDFRLKVTEYVLARIKNTNVSVYDLAYEMAMSERQLYRLAKSLTGCTPAQLIKDVRLQKAYELAISGQIFKIEDLAQQVGFEGPSYFAKQFFERFGKRVSDMW